MKKFLYSRLHELSADYGFYIPPVEKIGVLFDAIADDLAGKEKKLFLQNIDGKITFGVQETTTLVDEYGRPRQNFMGYQLEPHETAADIPFHDAIQSKFKEITEEAHHCHEKLDKDRSCGKNLQDMKITFDKGTYQAGNAWDEAVTAIRKDPSKNVLLMFDEHGKSIHIRKDIMAKFAAATADKASSGHKASASQTAEKTADKPKMERNSSPAEKPAKMRLGGKLAIVGGTVALLGAIGYWAFKAKHSNKEQENPAQVR